jgi:hypothetical protein
MNVRVLLALAGILLSPQLFAQTGHVAVNETDEKAVAQAIEDEMYDEGCQGYVGDIGQPAGGNTYQVRAYIQPQLATGKDEGEVGKGLGWVIYKFRPLGEVYRMFWFKNDGMAVLGGNPQWNFPRTESSYLTIYMDDDKLCRLKHDWVRTNFELDTTPPVQRVRDAQRRQKIRLGEQYRNHRRDCSFNWR